MVPAGLRLERPRVWRIARAGSSLCRKERNQSTDAGRHFGLVLNDKEAARRPLPA